MCFGGSKTVKAPPPTPPTTFDYSAANRGQPVEPQQRAAAVLATTTPQSSFGSDLGASSPTVTK